MSLTNGNITVVLPLGATLTEEEQKRFAFAVQSISNNQTHVPSALIVVGPANAIAQAKLLVEESAEKNLLDGTAIQYVTNKKNTSIAGNINAAVKKVKTKYFSYLEFDDAYRPNYFMYAEKYTTRYPDAALILPIVSEHNSDGQLLAYRNEVMWTPNFTENLGSLDFTALEQYANVYLSGGVMRTDVYNEVGGIKESLKLTFIYEFLLRLTQLGYKVDSIPKLLYMHTAGRKGSYLHEVAEGLKAMTDQESHFWFETAHKECYFTDDRAPEYDAAAYAQAQAE